MVRGRSVPRVIRASKAPRPVLPDPFSPTSPDYAERAAYHAVDVGEGVVRVDCGTPVGLVQDILKDAPPNT